jgi:hypothetical protein
MGDLTEPVLKDRLDVHAFFHSIDACHVFPTCNADNLPSGSRGSNFS